MFLLFCDFLFIVFAVIRNFLSSFFLLPEKSKFERNFYFCYLFSFDVEVDTNSILLSRCLLDRIISLLGIHGFVKCLHIYVKRIISQAEGVKHTFDSKNYFFCRIIEHEHEISLGMFMFLLRNVFFYSIDTNH